MNTWWLSSDTIACRRYYNNISKAKNIFNLQFISNKIKAKWKYYPMTEWETENALSVLMYSKKF